MNIALQILAALTGCHKTALNTNLIYDGERHCPYDQSAATMNRFLGQERYTRDEIKKPHMVTFYGSTAQPIKLFGKDSPELEAFNNMLWEEFTGAMEAMDDIFGCWQSDQDYHAWTLPDGHTAYCPSTEMQKVRVEIDSLKTSYTHQRKVQTCSEYYRPLVANVIHS